MVSPEASSVNVNNSRVTTATSVDIIIELDSITTIKQGLEYALVEFLGGKDVSAVVPTGLLL